MRALLQELSPLPYLSNESCLIIIKLLYYNSRIINAWNGGDLRSTFSLGQETGENNKIITVRFLAWYPTGRLRTQENSKNKMLMCII
jgi:hypothetical protein